MLALHRFSAFLTENRKLQLENICCAVEGFLCVSGGSDCLRFVIYPLFYDGRIAIAADVAFILNDAFQTGFVPACRSGQIFYLPFIEALCNLQQGLSVQIIGKYILNCLAFGWVKDDFAVLHCIAEGNVSCFHIMRSFPRISR